MNNSRQIYKFASIISSVIEPWRDFDSMDNRIDEKKKKEKKRKEKNGKNHIFIPCSMDSYRSHRRRNHEFEIGAVGNKPIKKENP